MHRVGKFAYLLPMRLLPAIAICLLCTTVARAQTEDLPPPPPGYKPLVPDTPEHLSDQLSVRKPGFTLKFGLAPILDYTWFSQDAASIEQSGAQENTWDIRSARIQARGTIFSNKARPWRYLISFEYRGFDSDPDHDWNFTDWTLTVPVGPLGDLSIGKEKEGFVYEMVGDAANLPHLERLMSPFFTSRNIGFRLDRTLLDKRMTASLGAFNDWFTKDLSYDESGWDVAARVTGLPYINESGRRFLHLAASWRYVGADNGVVRYRGRPESNVADYYVDSRDIEASHANNFGLEALWNEGPVSFLGEYVQGDVSSTVANDPSFHGYYVTGSWVLTGEHRPYDRKVGYARRVVPEKRWGSLELIARYGIVDVSDQAIDGGYMKKWFVALNWWATRRWRFSVGGGQARLDKDGLHGVTDQFMTRMQWIY